MSRRHVCPSLEKTRRTRLAGGVRLGTWGYYPVSGFLGVVRFSPRRGESRTFPTNHLRLPCSQVDYEPNRFSLFMEPYCLLSDRFRDPTYWNR